MKIDELSDEQKTIMLARLCGWNTVQYGSKTWVTCQDEPFSTTNLYQPIFMLLAWRVLNWAIENLPKFMRIIEENFLLIGVLPYFIIPPAEAQRAWLDRILSLAIEAGMVAGDED